MHNKTIHIVCTRKLSAELISRAASNGIIIRDIELLDIQPIPVVKFQSALLQSQSPLVFTSAHAVQAVAPLMGKISNQTAFSIEGNTSEMVKANGFKLFGIAANATQLAHVIAAKNVNSVLHCTTTHRRNELENGLANYGIAYSTLHVYEKKLTPQKIDSFDGVMFFSPSQVDAFLIANQLETHTPAFSVGSTTANHLKEQGHQHIVIAEQASAEQLLETVLKFYKKENEQHTFIA
jgi:uroporphyrinogen-III synthase